MNELTYRKAKITDLPRIVELLFEDELGQTRESQTLPLDKNYIKAFDKIDRDSNQYLMIVENDIEIMATCHLTILPSLTFIGATRMQIDAVHVACKYRNLKIGTKMIDQAILYAKKHGVSIIQLTTNKKRTRAKNFYERIGFEASHEGMKLYLHNKL